MKASIVTIGDEILLGQLVDTNSTWLADNLTQESVVIQNVLSISDKLEDIVESLELLSSASDLIIVTGGLGPTKDDVTKKALAEFMNTDMYFDETMFNKITAYFEKVGFTLTEAHRLQCYLPKGIEVLENKMGTAPGMYFTQKGTHILSLPGVPYEMKWIFENSFLPLLKSINNLGVPTLHRTIRTVGIGETRVEAKIRDIIDELPEGLSVAYLPGLGQVKVRLTARGQNAQDDVMEKYKTKLTNALGDYVYGFEKTLLEQALMDVFVRKGKTLATAESCTGGQIAAKIVSVSGSSKYFLGGSVSYSNEMKRIHLGVQEETLIEQGAVSEQTVIEMLDGLLQSSGADIGVAVSGIAGPGGGTPDKPVGTVWLAWGSKGERHTEKLQLGKDRIKNIEYTTVVAMNRLRLFLTH
ncbi:MAG: competence/damage-inducible protein A [Saprospiraceae bacterium]|nr:competence/damage-inducible protein A [Saprospiraceae bacterium]